MIMMMVIAPRSRSCGRHAFVDAAAPERWLHGKEARGGTTEQTGTSRCEEKQDKEEREGEKKREGSASVLALPSEVQVRLGPSRKLRINEAAKLKYAT